MRDLIILWLSLLQEQQRTAAAVLLQKRLPQLLQRRRHMLAVRAQLATWAPWLAHLHAWMGLAAADAAKRAQQAAIASAAEQQQSSSASSAEVSPRAGAPARRPGSATGAAELAPASKAKPASGASKPKAAKAAAPKPVAGSTAAAEGEDSTHTGLQVGRHPGRGMRTHSVERDAEGHSSAVNHPLTLLRTTLNAGIAAFRMRSPTVQPARTHGAAGAAPNAGPPVERCQAPAGQHGAADSSLTALQLGAGRPVPATLACACAGARCAAIRCSSQPGTWG